MPPALVLDVLERLEATATVFALTHVRAVGLRPAGDLILCDVAREDASVLLDDLRDLGVDRDGSITVQEIETVISAAAQRAEQRAHGFPADAVIWEEVEKRTSESAELSVTFLAFIVLATLIAGAGILSDSLLPIIGAMIVSPDFGPLAGICVALGERRLALARRSLRALAVGFAVAIALMLAATELLQAVGEAPDHLNPATHPATIFISEPNVYSVVVALLAGIVGVLSLTTAKSGALIGVLISVTTIPAAANVGVASAYADWTETRGALAQLGINVAAIVVAGTATLVLQRAFYERRRRRHVRGLALVAAERGERRDTKTRVP